MNGTGTSSANANAPASLSLRIAISSSSRLTPPQANNRLVVHVTRLHKTFKLYDGRQTPGLEWEEVHVQRPAVWSAASLRPHQKAGPIRIATDLFLTPSTLQLLLTFVVADDRCPCGSRGLHQAELLELLAPHGEVAVSRFDYKRYVGAQIGVHNPQGRRVGKVSHLRNRELLFAVAPTSAQASEAARAAERAMA